MDNPQWDQGAKQTEEVKYDFEIAVVGSGFGGTIAALELGKVLKERNLQEKLCIIERGQWYISPEGWLEKNKLAQFIEKRPHDFWAMPDNSRGLWNVLAKLRFIPHVTEHLGLLGDKHGNPNGLYDVKKYRPTYATVASGVGGGSLIYSGVVTSPEPEIFDDVYYEKDRGYQVPNPENIWKPKWKIPYNELEPYMMYAKYQFIEVSKIYTVVTGKYEDAMWLPKTRALSDAKTELEKNPPNSFPFKLKFELADLAVTEAPGDPVKPENFCRRQGRCNFGCLPGARHTLNKKFPKAIQDDKLPIYIYELAEVEEIKPIDDGKAGYLVCFKDNRGEDLKKKDPRTSPIRVRKLILAAGTYGTLGLILRSVEKFPMLNNNVGKGLSINGDNWGFATPTAHPVYPTRGPIDTCHVRFSVDMGPDKRMKHIFTIEDVTIPRMIASTFATMIEAHKKIIREGRERPHLLPITRFYWRFPLLAIELFFRDTNDLKRIIKVMKKQIQDPEWSPAKEGLHAWLLGSKRHRKQIQSSLEEFAEERYDELDDDYRLSNAFFFGCMGIDRANGEVKRNAMGEVEWNKKTGDFDIKWPDLLKDPILEEIRAGMRELGKKMLDPCCSKKPEECLILNPMKQLLNVKDRWFTIHPLGGCSMETYQREGAVDICGRLLKKKKAGETDGLITDKTVERDPGLGINQTTPPECDGTTGAYYPNLYIVDGSIIPTALAVNPSLTISALAFRIIDHIIRDCYKEKPILRNLEVGKVYRVTIKEHSKRMDGTFAVATVNPIYKDENGEIKNIEWDENGEIKKVPEWDRKKEIKKVKWDNIVYIEGKDLKKVVGSPLHLRRQADVIINRIINRVAYGSIVKLHDQMK